MRELRWRGYGNLRVGRCQSERIFEAHPIRFLSLQARFRQAYSITES